VHDPNPRVDVDALAQRLGVDVELLAAVADGTVVEAVIACRHVDHRSTIWMPRTVAEHVEAWSDADADVQAARAERRR
jgi:predicted kinase